VRALIGKDQTAEAIKEAAAFLALQPRSAVAEVAAGEAAYRAANFDDMGTHILKAFNDDRCDGRVLALAANLYYLHAHYGTESTLLANAHRVRPNDELIRRDWISSLPRTQREAELARYLVETKALSDKDRAEYTNEEDHLKAHHPNECRITAKTPTVTIPFAYLRTQSEGDDTSYGLEVSFNSRKRRLEIDTGASGITLTRSAAKSLGLAPEYRLHTGGIGDDGEVDSYLTHVADIQIGGIQISNCMVEVISEKSKYRMNVDGLIGLDVFHNWLSTLDFPNLKLILAPLPPRPLSAELAAMDEDDRPFQDGIEPAEMTNWLHFVRVGHEILLPTFINSGNVHYMLADTGASISNISIPYAREYSKLHSQNDVSIYGISGEVKKVLVTDNISLQFGKVKMPSAPYYAFDLTNLSHNAGVEISGILSLPTLSRLSVSIDYRDNLIQLKYDPTRDMRRF
jgi:predicted aspartyl protease